MRHPGPKDGVRTFFRVKKLFHEVKNVVGGAVYRGDGSLSGLRVRRGAFIMRVACYRPS